MMMAMALFLLTSSVHADSVCQSASTPLLKCSPEVIATSTTQMEAIKSLMQEKVKNGANSFAAGDLSCYLNAVNTINHCKPQNCFVYEFQFQTPLADHLHLKTSTAFHFNQSFVLEPNDGSCTYSEKRTWEQHELVGPRNTKIIDIQDKPALSGRKTGSIYTLEPYPCNIPGSRKKTNRRIRLEAGAVNIVDESKSSDMFADWVQKLSIAPPSEPRITTPDSSTVHIEWLANHAFIDIDANTGRPIGSNFLDPAMWSAQGCETTRPDGTHYAPKLVLLPDQSFVNESGISKH